MAFNNQHFTDMSDYINLVRERNREYEASCGRPPLAYVLTFGCQQNEADSERIAGMAQSMGYKLTGSAEESDLIVINTCAVRDHAEKKALSIIGQFKHVKNARPGVLIGVCGCMTAQQHRIDELKNSYPYVDFTLEPALLHRLPEAVFRALSGEKRTFWVGGEEKIIEDVPVRRESSYKAWVSIMYGCNNFCSYCIVPHVRGRERSRDSSQIYREVRALVESGYKDITLLGQNVNSYKSDCDFSALLKKLCSIDGDFKLHFMTSHPKDVPDSLISTIAENEKIARHFHLPLQSGSDRILAAMNRRYTTRHYMSILEKLRALLPDIVVTTDIIVGFPGETEEDFEGTLDIIRRARFDMIFSFIYSKRKSTPAERMENQIPPAVKSERYERLTALQNSISKEKNRQLLDKTVKVLVEGESKNNPDVYTGRTEGGKIVHFKAESILPGSYAYIKINRAEAFALYGELQNKILYNLG